jgi:hypothetical protein
VSRSVRLVVHTILLATLVPAFAFAKPKDAPRYSPPKNGQSGRIDIEQYYLIDGPKEAARILLEEAKLAQVDIDQRWGGPARNEIRLGSGPIIPDTKDKRFFEQAAKRVGASDDEQETICVIKCNRVLTIRETAEMMNQGIRIYRGAPFDALFARVPSSAAQYLRGFEAVDWVGEFTPGMKYNTEARFSPDRACQVVSLVGDAAQCRRDLDRLGGKVLGTGGTAEMHHRYFAYVVTIPPDRIPELASLWWVQEIYQYGPTANE